jgi:DNA-directed RNA polymerase subunit M/transcription elongation factor TFIIS
MSTSCTNWPVCPHCGDVIEPTDYTISEGDNYLDCDECEKEFWVTTNIEVTYSTAVPTDTPEQREQARKDRIAHILADMEAYRQRHKEGV